MPAVRYQLEAGDWLYIPGGYWHRTSAVTDSCSLSVGVQAATAMDIYDLMRSRLVQSILWRQRLPLPIDISQEELLQDLLEDIGQIFQNEQFLASLVGHPLNRGREGSAART